MQLCYTTRPLLSLLRSSGNKNNKSLLLSCFSPLQLHFWPSNAPGLFEMSSSIFDPGSRLVSYQSEIGIRSEVKSSLPLLSSKVLAEEETRRFVFARF